MNYKRVTPQQYTALVEVDFNHPSMLGTGTWFGPPPIEMLNEHIEEMNKKNWKLFRVEGDGTRWLCIWDKFEEYVKD